MLGKAKRRIRDLCHKATRQVAEAFPARRAMWASRSMTPPADRAGTGQQVSSACTRKIIQQLDYKTAGAITLSEAYSSQTCPVCGERSKQAGSTLPDMRGHWPRDAVARQYPGLGMMDAPRSCCAAADKVSAPLALEPAAQ